MKQLSLINDGACYFPVELHCHTPGSTNDGYKIKGRQYSDVNYADLEIYAKELGIIPQNYNNGNEGSDEQNKEWITPAIIVANAYLKGVRLLVITDHDNCDWYKK